MGFLLLSPLERPHHEPYGGSALPKYHTGPFKCRSLARLKQGKSAPSQQRPISSKQYSPATTCTITTMNSINITRKRAQSPEGREKKTRPRQSQFVLYFIMVRKRRRTTGIHREKGERTKEEEKKNRWDLRSFPTGATSPRTTRGVSPAEIPHRALQMP